MKVRDLVRLVESDGWKHVRTTGSHRHFKHPSKPSVVTIPGHPGDDVATGTLRAILKAAGVEDMRLHNLQHTAASVLTAFMAVARMPAEARDVS